MSKILVIYDSRTGNTESMAKAVFEGASKVKGVEVDLLKVGTAFSISRLGRVDAIILGSPTIYGSVTPEMKIFLENVEAHNASKKINLSGKVGGAFGSYGWDGGWVTEKLSSDMKALGLRVVAPVVSAVDKSGGFGISIDKDSLQTCRELGKVVAETVV